MKAGRGGMSQRLDSASAEDHARLDEVTRMIRAGLAEDGTIDELQERLRRDLDKLRASRSSFDEVDQIRISTLDAEFHYQTGKYAEAVAILKRFWTESSDRTSRAEWCLRSDAQPPLDRKRRRDLLRQKLWALLHYVFYDLYTDGKYGPAAEQLLLLEQIIHQDLQSEATKREPAYVPHGTLAICRYFLGHCYRGERQFRRAEKCFLQAQASAQRRLELKLDPPKDGAEGKNAPVSPEKRAEAIAYHSVFTARVLGVGVGWIALQEGRLTHAEHLLRSADAVLLNTRQESLKLFVKSLLWIAVRRRARFHSPDYAEAMSGLERLSKRFGTLGDVAGDMRCQAELARGALDVAEFTAGASKAQPLAQAKRCLDVLKHSGRPRHLVRSHLLAARYALHKHDDGEAAREDDLREARRELAEADRTLDKHRHLKAHFETDRVNINLMVTQASRGRDTQQDAEEAERRVRSNLASRSRRVDPVLEAEAELLLAAAAQARQDDRLAHRHLGRWSALRPVVENFYLRRFADRLKREMKPQPFRCDTDFELDPQAIAAQQHDFWTWIGDTVHARCPYASAKELGKIYGRNRATIDRWWHTGTIPRSRGDVAARPVSASAEKSPSKILFAKVQPILVSEKPTPSQPASSTRPPSHRRR